ncbi:hypothetical protein LV779_26905 [Streptomyces thinghirensis]|nr:hypothetical protein [Streptomyces thinghirensis]
MDGAVNWQGRSTTGTRRSSKPPTTCSWTSAGRPTGWPPRGRAERLGAAATSCGAGVDVESDGWNTSENWDAIVPRDSAHITSIGLYRPEWTRNHLPEDRRTPEDFHAADNRFWTGASLDSVPPGRRGRRGRRGRLAGARRVGRRPVDGDVAAVRGAFNTGPDCGGTRRAPSPPRRPGTTSASRTGCRPGAGWCARRASARRSPSTSRTPGGAAAASWSTVNSTGRRSSTCTRHGCRWVSTRSSS